MGVPLLKLKGRDHAVVEVKGARAGRAAVVGALRWLEANEVPYGRGGGVTGRWGFRCSGYVGVSLLKFMGRGHAVVEVE